MKRILTTTLSLVLAIVGMQAQSVTAAFTAEEARNVYFSDDFDDQTLPQWDVVQTATNGTWKTLASTADYKTIVPSSTRRLYVQSYKDVAMNEDIITKESLTVLPGTRVDFYAMMNLGTLMNANFFVLDGDTRTVLVDFAPWIAAHEDYAEKQWDSYSVDLSAFVGKSVKLGFNYSGTSNVASNYASVEDISVYQYQLDGIPATVEQGKSVHFVSQSTGDGLTYQWTFENGNPATSTDAAPVVAYDKIGTYAVSLTVTAGSDSDTKTIDGFVKVVYAKPVAAALYPLQGYTIYTNCNDVVAPAIPVTFRDNSVGYPTEWMWQFLDSKKNVVATDSAQNPTVTFATAGTYTYTLTAKNPAGESTTSASTIQVGSAAATNGRHIWNVASAEKPANVTGRYYDNADASKGFIGSNDEGVMKWAEYFHYAGQPISIEGVTLIFSSITASENTSGIKMSICEAGDDGLPGRELYSATPSLVASSGVWSTTNSKKTWIDLSKDPTFVNSDFFIVVSGVPAYNAGANKVQIAAIPHEDKELNTAYVFKDNQWKSFDQSYSLPFIPYVNFNQSKIDAAAANSLEAGFTALEAQDIIFGEDFEGTLDHWAIDTVGTTTWRLLAVNSTNDTPLNDLDPANLKKLYVQGNKTVASNERIVTAEPVAISETTEVGFHLYSAMGDLYEGHVLAVVGTDTITLADLSTVAKEKQWTWVRVDLSSLAGQSARVGFSFAGLGNASAALHIDNFRVYNTGSDVKANVRTGQPVHFRNLSTRGATYAWEFTGGTPATSSEAEPVVTYDAVGSYDVKLSVTYGDKTVSKQVEGFVSVVPQIPTARVEFVDGYHRAVGGSLLVPAGKPFTLRDRSTNNPTSWHWVVMDSKKNVVATADEPQITVQIDTVLTGTKSAFYQFTLEAGNATGSTTYTSGTQEIKVGSSDAIWNINKEESAAWSIYDNSIPGGKGYYGGSNDLGITAWAEKFAAPLDTAAITQIGILFSNVSKYERGTKITVSLNEVDADGLPGDVFGDSEITKNPSELTTSSRKSTTYTVKFRYDDNFPVLVTKPFFVVVNGFGPYNGGESNDIRMMTLKRDTQERNSVWVLRNGQWQESDVSLSMFVTPWLSYVESTVDAAITTGIVNVAQPMGGQSVYYDLSGHRLLQAPAHGLYIERQTDGRVVKRLAR